MIELIRSRRSIRQYENKKITQDKLDILQETLLRSPTSKNLKLWEFIFVDDKILLDKLSRSKEHGAGFLKNAPLGIVICSDADKSDVWIEDCSIAAAMVQLAAHSLGLGTCWIQIRNRNHSQTESCGRYIQQLLGIPENYKVECIIAAGYPAEQKDMVPKDQLDFSKIKKNNWNSS